MAVKTTTRVPARDDYFDLVQEFPLRRIINDDQNEEALQMSDRLLFKGPEGSLSGGEQAYLDALRALIREYESKRYPIRRSSRQVRLRFLLDESGTTQAKFAAILGIKQPAASLILAGKRSLTVAAIKRLSAHFKLSADYFI